MKKLSKFRKWLIKKLGGITPDQKIEPIIIEQKHKIKELKVSVLGYGLMTQEDIARELSLKLGEALDNYITIVKTYDPICNRNKYTAILKVVEK